MENSRFKQSFQKNVVFTFGNGSVIGYECTFLYYMMEVCRLGNMLKYAFSVGLSRTIFLGLSVVLTKKINHLWFTWKKAHIGEWFK